MRRTTSYRSILAVGTQTETRNLVPAGTIAISPRRQPWEREPNNLPIQAPVGATARSAMGTKGEETDETLRIIVR